jgi:hypothetical protein
MNGFITAAAGDLLRHESRLCDRFGKFFMRSILITGTDTGIGKTRAA